MGRAKYVLLGLLLALPLFGWVVVAHAQSFRSGSNITVPAGKVVNNALFAAGNTLDIAGVVNGDLFCAGQNITISSSATINGDVMCAGQNVSLSGRVNGDVRLAGQNVTIDGLIRRNATVAGQTFTETSKAQIGGDLSVGGQDTTLNGPVGRDLAAGVHNLTINNSVGRNVQADVQKLALGSGAKVAGNIHYASNKNLTRSSGAQVTGSITRTTPTANKHTGSWVAFALLTGLYALVSLLLVALVLALLLPRVFRVATETARRSMGRTFLIGLIASIAVPIVLLILLLTIVGIPLALLAGLVWLLIVLLSGAFSAHLLGSLILRNRGTSVVWTMLLGAVILLLLSFVPILDIITGLLSLWFGLGSILQQLPRLRKPGDHAGSAEVVAEA